MFLEQGFQGGFAGQIASGDDDLRITRAPVLQGGGDGGGQAVGGVFEEGHAGAGEEACFAGGIGQQAGGFAQIAGLDAGQAHFGLALRADQGGDGLLPFQGHAHGIGTENQQARAVGVGFGAIAAGLDPGEFHWFQVPEVASSLAVIWSARMRIRRRAASSWAAKPATVEPVAE